MRPRQDQAVKTHGLPPPHPAAGLDHGTGPPPVTNWSREGGRSSRPAGSVVAPRHLTPVSPGVTLQRGPAGPVSPRSCHRFGFMSGGESVARGRSGGRAGNRHLVDVSSRCRPRCHVYQMSDSRLGLLIASPFCLSPTSVGDTLPTPQVGLAVCAPPSHPRPVHRSPVGPPAGGTRPALS